MSRYSPNYDYVLDEAIKSSTCRKPKILDYGCGKGQVVRLGLKRGMDIWGADTFSEYYQDWGTGLDHDVRAHIRQINHNIIDFPDSHFDVVISNQVFEHVRNVPVALNEIKRVLKPGGAFLTLFPTKGVWFEGHVGLYFPHWLKSWPTWQWRYMYLMRKLGFGYYGRQLDARQWATSSQNTLNNACIYHSWRDVRRWWWQTFGSSPQSLETEYMLYRISRHPGLKIFARLAGSSLFSFFLKPVCLIRAGRVFIIRRTVI